MTNNPSQSDSNAGISNLQQNHSKEGAILQLIEALTSFGLDVSEMQETFSMRICEIFNARICSFLLLKQGYGEMVLHQGDIDKSIWFYQIDLENETSPLKRCIQDHQAVHLHQNNGDWDPGMLAPIQDIEVQSLLCVPMVIDDRVIGVMAVLDDRKNAFDEIDEALLTILSKSVTQKIHSENVILALKVSNADLEVNHWQLLNSRNILRALFDSIPTSIYIIDRKYTLAAVNMHRADRTGSPPNVLVGRHCYEALYHLDAPCPDCRVIETLFGGENTQRSKRQWEPNQEAQEWEISTYPIQDDNSLVTQAIILEQDVTEKRRLEATLAQSEKLAAVGQLAAGLAHEINNPLTAVIANAQLLQRELPADDDKQELVDLITRAGARANQVVRSLLDVTRKEQYDFAPVDINDTIQKALAFLHHEFVFRFVELEQELGKDLPKVIASQDHLQGVWLNLMTNGMDAMENQPKKMRIRTFEQNHEVHVVISDTGIGIPPEMLSRIFEPFYTTKAPGHGTGLGLPVCHRVIKQHGGRILVDSQVSVGTQFTVILPIS